MCAQPLAKMISKSVSSDDFFSGCIVLEKTKMKEIENAPKKETEKPLPSLFEARSKPKFC